MAEITQDDFLRIDTGDSLFEMRIIQDRLPRFVNGRGCSVSLTGKISRFALRYAGTGGDSIIALSCHGTDGAFVREFHLGNRTNFLDVYGWGVPDYAAIESDLIFPGQLVIQHGEYTIEGRSGVFDRRVEIPINMGSLTLNLSAEARPYPPAL